MIRVLRRSAPALLALLASCSGGAETAPAVTRLPAVDGTSEESVPVAGADATVALFVATDCPISNYFAPEMERIRAEYEPRGIAFRLIYAVPGEDIQAIASHRESYGLGMPALLDPRHELLSRAGASVTPEAAVFSDSGELLYRGRIDDTYVAYGKQRAQPTRRDLRLALDAILAGDRPEPATTEAIGCFIPDLGGSSLPEEGIKSPR